MLLSIFVFSINTDVTRISAEDVQMYEITYEFVMEDASQVPGQLLKLLPEKRVVESASFVSNVSFEDVQIDGTTYVFKGWEPDDFEADSDRKCIGTWETKTGMDEEGRIIRFDFVELGKLDGGYLPEEVRKLIPEEIYLKKDEKPELRDFPETQGYRFIGWEAGVDYEDGSSLYFGVWSRIGRTPGTSEAKSIDRPDREADKRITSDGTPVGIPGSAAPHQQLDNEDAYCYEPDVTGYANKTHSYWHVETLTGKAAAIIGMGKLNRMPYGAIQAALWNYLKGGIYHTYGSYEVDPDADVYSRKGRYECTAAVYATYRTGSGDVQGLIMSGGCSLKSSRGSVKILKKAKETAVSYVEICPNNYSLEDAVYGIYSDRECTKQAAVLATKEDGSSNAVSLDTGTYYVREKTASRGFRLDPTVYECKVKADATTTITSIEEPVTAIFDPILYKIDHLSGQSVQGFEEAQFILKYYDSISDDVSLMDAEYSWTFRPIFSDGKAEIIFDLEHLVNGDDSLFEEEMLMLPLGVFSIEESKAPAGYARDEEIYYGRISEKDGQAIIDIDSKGALKVYDNILEFSEMPQRISIGVAKADAQTRENVPQGLATFEGGEFEVYFLDGNDRKPVGVIITDEYGKGSIDKDSSGEYLLPGRYFIKEVKAPEGYHINEEEFEIEAIIDGDSPVSRYSVTIMDQVTETRIHKIDPEGEYVEGAMLELWDSQKNVLMSWTSDDQPMIIRGLAEGESYILHEVSAPEGYMIAEDIGFTIGDDTDIKMIDPIPSVSTAAYLRETGTKECAAEGIVHIIDKVEYRWLYPGKEYILKGQLIDKGKNDEKLEKVIMEAELRFVPEEMDGSVEMEYVIDIEAYADHEFVVYEQLYILDPEQRLVCEHRDYNDKDQTVYINELYTAQMVLYKVGNNNRKNKLNGAYYQIKTSRRKQDGSIVEKDLGIHVTGGIYLQSDRSFTVTLYRDEQLQDVMKEYRSFYDKHFRCQAVIILNLDDGRYYVSRDDRDTVESYDIAKGAIILNDQIEGTDITYIEVKAPNSYHIDSSPYTFSVGNERDDKVLENYRSNSSIFIPITGVD